MYAKNTLFLMLRLMWLTPGSLLIMTKEKKILLLKITLNQISNNKI